MFKRLLRLGSCLSFAPSEGRAARSGTDSGRAVRYPDLSHAEPIPPSGTEPEPVAAHLMAAGDLLIHDALNTDAYLAESGGYDFTHIMEQAAGQLALADYALANLETTLAGGPDYSGYPHFNSPDELAWNAKAVGFDMLSTSNNHTRDKGMKGIFRTLDVLDEAGVAHVGACRSQKERDANRGVYVADVGGISVAFLAYTYKLNGCDVDSDERYAVNLFNLDSHASLWTTIKTYAARLFRLDYYNTLATPDYDLLKADMAAARALDTDLIAVMMHWGLEYHIKQNKRQEKMARFLVGQGADLILGGHPHVLQPYKTITARSPDGRKRQGFVIYSLGNFISNQHSSDDARYDLATRTTVILDLELTRGPQGNTALTGVRYTPYYMLRQNEQPVGQRLRLVDVRQAIAGYEAGTCGYIDQDTYKHLQEALDLCHEILGEEGDRPSS